jgi:uncharacterized protein YbjT (DUF2867 family)
MRIVIAGGHGTIALLLSRLLADAGHQPVGLIRSEAQVADLAAAGAEAVVLDLEHADLEAVSAALRGADAAVFAAGAGGGSNSPRTQSIDRDGAILFADAAVSSGVRRLVVVSSAGADTGDAASDDQFQIYLRAKADADAAIREKDLDWTILRPVSLTDSAPTGRITVGETVDRGSIPRADVAAIIVAALEHDLAIHRQFEATGGGQPIAEALRSL